ncbi:MAG: SAM-dependent methyltransferase [Devosia nanyangense]|uniref:SAM-dependent methyltransferase n=1 Tax=Devosia nanyangense TaxID=1228055 RepID=A0A933L032_9HYPH|nr:SAM-dependent methyltransferase [Devosia nanyangense]
MRGTPARRTPIIDTSLSRSDQFFSELETAFGNGSLVKLGLRAYDGTDVALRSIDIKPVIIKRQPQLSFTWHYKTRDVVKNHPWDEALLELKGLVGIEFNLAQMATTAADWSLDFQGKSPRLKQLPPTQTAPVSLAHDRAKVRPIPAGGSIWMRELGVTDKDGKVLPTAQDKFRQINRYVEILGPLLKAIPAGRLSKVVDMGAGKGYLTFAVADYLANTLQSGARTVGVELRPDLVDLCNGIAAKSGLGNLSFVQGSIDAFDGTGASVLIALHACDTATDDAIAKGIAAGAELIVVAPCCHKQIRREIETANAPTPLDYLLKHGIFVERQAEMVTDGIRALILEYFGYSTKVFEFISDVHTPKNVLIVGTRSGRGRYPAILTKVAEAKAMFGIRRHYLEDATGL